VRDLPELGSPACKGRTLKVETLLAAKPDMTLDFGMVSPTYADPAQKVQDQTGVPYVLIDDYFANTSAAIRQVADLRGVPECE
jgi:iron complex transport system substrate-binding protein